MSIRSLTAGVAPVATNETKSARSETPGAAAFTSVLAHELGPAPERAQAADSDQVDRPSRAPQEERAAKGSDRVDRPSRAPHEERAAKVSDEPTSPVAEEPVNDDAVEVSSESAEDATSVASADVAEPEWAAAEIVVVTESAPRPIALPLAVLPPEVSIDAPLAEETSELLPKNGVSRAATPVVDVGNRTDDASTMLSARDAQPEVADDTRAKAEPLAREEGVLPATRDSTAKAQPQFGSEDAVQVSSAEGLGALRMNGVRGDQRADRQLRDPSLPSAPLGSRGGDVGVQLAQTQLGAVAAHAVSTEEEPAPKPPSPTEAVEAPREQPADKELHRAEDTIEATREHSEDPARGADAALPGHEVVEQHAEPAAAHERLDGGALRTPARESRATPTASRSVPLERTTEGSDDRRHQAAATAVNHMTLRHGAAVDVELPELGRIHIDARTVAGEVDVDMRSVDTSTVMVLQSVSASIESELRNSSVDLRNLDIRGHAGGYSSRQPTSSGDDRSRGERSSPRDRQTASPSPGGSPAASPSGRVRIVL